MKQDPFHPKCLPVHIALLVELNKTNVLFHLAHRWDSFSSANSVPFLVRYFLQQEESD
jgi:hypothetical protein